jgi:hypothetical protein
MVEFWKVRCENVFKWLIESLNPIIITEGCRHIHNSWTWTNHSPTTPTQSTAFPNFSSTNTQNDTVMTPSSSISTMSRRDPDNSPPPTCSTKNYTSRTNNLADCPRMVEAAVRMGPSLSKSKCRAKSHTRRGNPRKTSMIRTSLPISLQSSLKRCSSSSPILSSNYTANTSRFPSRPSSLTLRSCSGRSCG